MNKLPLLVVLAAPRTGTNLLKACLAQDARVLNLRELLNPKEGAQHPSFGFWRIISKRGGIGDGTDPETRLRAFRNYFSDVRAANPDRILLCDLKYDQIGLVDTLWRMPDQCPPPLRAALEANAAVIHLTRRNSLAQFASILLAMRDDVWVRPQRRSEESESPARLRFNTGRLVEELQRIEFRITVAKYWLSDYRAVLDLDYEELLDSGILAAEVRTKIEALIGSPLQVDQPPRTKKIAPPLADLIENLDEVRAVLRGTDYAWCLEEETGRDRHGRSKKRGASRVNGPIAKPRLKAGILDAPGKTVLVGTELGVSIRTLEAIATLSSILAERDVRVVWAVRDIAKARLALGDTAEIIQAPAWPTHRHFGTQDGPSTFADVLTRTGYGDLNKLQAMVTAWAGLLELVRPDAVIACNSPALLLNLYDSGVPVVSCGTAFSLPSVDYSAFPPWRGDGQPTIPEDTLLRVARTVRARRLESRPTSLVDVFRSGERIILGLAELDPYASFRKEPLVWPPGALLDPQPALPERRLYMELEKEVPKLEQIVQTVADLGIPVEAFLAGEVGGLPDFLRRRGHVVHDRPPDIGLVIARASHVFSQGWLPIAAAALSAGRAQLVLPGDDESWLIYRQLNQCNVARILDPQAGSNRLRNTIERFIADPNLPTGASEAAKRIAFRQPTEGADALFKAVERALGQHALQPALDGSRAPRAHSRDSETSV